MGTETFSTLAGIASSCLGGKVGKSETSENLTEIYGTVKPLLGRKTFTSTLNQLIKLESWGKICFAICPFKWNRFFQPSSLLLITTVAHYRFFWVNNKSNKAKKHRPRKKKITAHSRVIVSRKKNSPKKKAGDTTERLNNVKAQIAKSTIKRMIEKRIIESHYNSAGIDMISVKIIKHVSFNHSSWKKTKQLVDTIQQCLKAFIHLFDLKPCIKRI